MKKILSLALLGLVVLSGCQSAQQEEPTNNAQGCEYETTCSTTTPADMSAYEGFMNEDNQFIDLPMDDFISKLDANETGIFYFGFASCPWCIEAVPIMNEAAEQEDVHIYYIDKKAETSTEEEIAKVEDRLQDLLQKNDDGKPTLFVPFVVIVKDGEILATHADTVPGHDAHERKMNEEEQADLRAIYVELFAKIK